MTEQATRKLTRAEACAELARRTRWLAPRPFCKYWFSPAGQRFAQPPDYFTSRDAAAELVQWVCSDYRLRCKFEDALFALWQKPKHYDAETAFDFLLAEPHEVTSAVCAALGIEVIND
jgi:hypothetical protein